jgi:Phosphotransferase enzyme family
MATTRLPFDEIRGALERIHTGDEVVAALDRRGAEAGWWHPGRSWRREYARLSDRRGDPFARLLFASDGDPADRCTVEVWRAGPPAGVGVEVAGVGHLVMRRFPDDDALPGIASVLDGPDPVTILRYRPTMRCTMRVDTALGPRFVKVLSADIDGESIHADGQAIAHASARGELGFAVAPSLGWDPRVRAHWQGPVAGTPAVGVLFGPEGPALAVRMGAAAATLTTSSLEPRRRVGRERQLAATRRYADRVAARLPRLASALDEFMRAVAPLHADDVDARARPIHEAPHPHQWLVDGDRLGLIDFDGFALGPPERDVATFTAEMEHENPTKMPVAAIIEGFRCGYESVTGPLDDAVLRAYLAHKRLARVQRLAQAVRPDNEQRAAAALERALDATR